MSKSYRNQLVEWAYESLLALASEEEINDRFPSDGAGWSHVIAGNGNEAIVSSVHPVMTVFCTLFLRDLVNALGPDVKNVESKRSMTCAGYSKLKPGDEWSGYEGYKICCKRAARNFTDQILAPVENKISECLDTIYAEETVITELDKAFYLGLFGDLGFSESAKEEEE